MTLSVLDRPPADLPDLRKPLTAAALVRVSRKRSKSTTTDRDRQSDRERSTAQQLDKAREVTHIDGRPVDLAADAVYAERQSASRFATRTRKRFAALVEAVRAGRYDVVIAWEIDRLSRELEAWAGFLNACRVRGVLIYVITHRRTYDPRIGRDWKALAEDGTDAAYFSEKLSVNVKRGHMDSIEQGRPGHSAPVGYRRIRDQHTGDLAWDPTATLDVVQDGQTVTVTGLWQQVPTDDAATVREIFEKVAARVPLNQIERELRERGVTWQPSKPGQARRPWLRSLIRDVALNPAYASLRPRPGGGYAQGRWPRIVSEALWRRAGAVIDGQRDRSTAPGKTVWLLSRIGSCACGATGSWSGAPTSSTGRQPAYFCGKCGARVDAEPADQYVTALVLGRLSRPDAAATLLTADTSAEAEQARAEAAQAKDLAAQWTAKLKTTPPDAADAVLATIAEFNQQAKAAARRAERLSTPAALEDWADALGNEQAVVERWAAASLPARKAVLRVVFDRLELQRSAYRGQPAKERITHRWREAT